MNLKNIYITLVYEHIHTHIYLAVLNKIYNLNFSNIFIYLFLFYLKKNSLFIYFHDQHINLISSPVTL